MIREELEELTKDQLRDHAEVAGVTVLALDSKGTMIDKILGEYVATDKKTAKFVDDTKKEIPLGALYDLQGNKINAPLYEVEIFNTESDKSDVDIIVNGHNIRVQRGKKVIMMEPYVQVLRDAVIETEITDRENGIIKESVKQLCYPHTARRIG